MAKIGGHLRVALLVVVVQLSTWTESASLYEVDDPLWELDSNNFGRIAFGKKTAWVIEFYSSWCGHCIRFAPHWQEFARDVENWKNVIEVGVVNCADADNTPICRSYEVMGYPTVKLFPSHLTEGDKGDKIEGGRELSHLRHSIIDFLKQNANRTIPSDWPKFETIKSTSLRSFWTDEQPTGNTAYIVIENPGSYLGSEIMLDLSIKKNVIVHRMINTNRVLLDELVPNYRNASLVLVSVDRNDHKEVLYTSSNNASDIDIRDRVFDIVIGGERVGKPTEVTTPNPDSNVGVSYNHVFMVDIENAVHYALHQEVPTHDLISGEKLSALRSFLLALKQYFPGTSNAKNYLVKLSDWINSHRGNITGARFAQKLDTLTTETEYLPPMRRYIGCSGSSSKFRGYPCSLWTLFHTLTVQAYEAYQENTMLIKESPQKVLHDIRGYVKNFFSCQHCAEHFTKISANLNVEAVFPTDTVMWLWQTHNKVNKRLAGDATEDPKHKKIQFPSEDSCKRCRMGPNDTFNEIPWDKSSILRYLRFFYNKDRIEIVNFTGEDVVSRNKEPNAPFAFDAGDNALVMPFNSSSISRPQWNFHIFTNFDVSLCFSLYLVSALLLIVIYLFFCRLSRRRKVRYRNFFVVYP